MKARTSTTSNKNRTIKGPTNKATSLLLRQTVNLFMINQRHSIHVYYSTDLALRHLSTSLGLFYRPRTPLCSGNPTGSEFPLLSGVLVPLSLCWTLTPSTCHLPALICPFVGVSFLVLSPRDACATLFSRLRLLVSPSDLRCHTK